uniref:Uncharacterized protein n=1 Tax=Romanomermis culicivorax TaxID=13658 RepID=A0A915KNW2_ROMCU
MARILYVKCLQNAQLCKIYEKNRNLSKKYWFGWPSVPRGLATRLFVNWVTQLTAQQYLDQYIHHQFIPYIRQNHRQGDYIFWPNQSENIIFVKKCDNPANVPEVRVIEDFWEYTSGRLLTGHLKKFAIEILQKIVLEHQERRKLVDDDSLRRFTALRKLKSRWNLKNFCAQNIYILLMCNAEFHG